MNDLTLFQYGVHEVRTIDVDGEPWFVASDVAKILGYRMASDMTRRIDGEDRGTRSVRTPSGDQDMTVISEPGLYVAVLGSKVPGARDFKRWVTHEVLPSIRRTGGYGAPAAALTDDEIVHQALTITARKVQELEATIAVQQPKADAWDHIVSSEGSWSFEEAAKVLFEQGVVQIGQQRLVARLVEWGYLYRDSKDRPHTYQRYLEQGLFVAKARTYTDQRTGLRRASSAPQVRITGKGLDMLHRRFRAGQLVLPGVPA
ncbi:phage antirepressor KilAC domain-containing protein [Brachybacterium sp. DNPG3]